MTAGPVSADPISGVSGPARQAVDDFGTICEYVDPAVEVSSAVNVGLG
jgi:hypothetical protein